MQKQSDLELLTKLYFRLLPYQIILLVINAITGIVDSLFASNFIGTIAMSAIGYYAPLNHFLFAVSIMLVSGSQLLVGEAMGRNDSNLVHGFFTTDIVTAVTIALLTSFVLAFTSLTDLTRFIIASADERQAVNMYMLGQAVGIPALVLGQQFFAFLSLENQTKLTMIASFVCIIINTVMDGFFVVVLKLGTLGLGLGTSAGMWAFLITMLLYYVTGKSKMKFSMDKYSFKNSAEIMKRGYPGALSRFVEMFRCIVVNALLVAYVGSLGLSAFAAVNSVMAVFWPIPFGMLAVTRMLFGITLGEEDRKSLADINRIVLVKCMIVQCVVTAVIVLLATPLTCMFYRDVTNPVYTMTLMGFRLLPLCMPLAVVSLHFSCYGQATEKKILSHLLPIMDGAGFVVLLSLVLIPLLKMNGLYIANILNGVCCALMVLFYLVAKLKRFPKNMEDILLIPEGFGVPENDRIDITVRDVSEVTRVSEQVVKFCNEKNIDKRRAFFSGLALEEMAGNVVEHGFTKDNKKHSIDIRVAHKDGDIIMRIKDNCRSFDPLQRIEVYDSEDMMKNAGIRLVNSIAKDVQYQNLLGLNVLTIRI